MRSRIKEISEIIEGHRENAFVVCHEDCWCWLVEECLSHLDLCLDKIGAIREISEDGE